MERPFPAYKGDQPYVFVSYAHEDAELVYPEITRLRDQGFNIWYDDGISPGSTWRDEVALALTQCKIFLFYISPRSVASTNCLKEVNFCLSRERRILSVHLEDTELPMGLELSLSDMQAIIRGELSSKAYQDKLDDSLRSMLPGRMGPIALPSTQSVTEVKTDERSIGILPLTNRNLNAEIEHLCEGIPEELINGLSKVDGLNVTSALTSKDRDLDIQAIGHRLNVETVLSGSIQKAGNRVRISIRLEQVSDGLTLWSNRYDQTLEDIFELQDDVARQVITALTDELGTDETTPIINVGTQNIDAYNAYLLGRHESRKATRRSLDNAIGYFQQATRLDREFDSAYNSLGHAFLGLRDYGAPQEEWSTQAEQAFARFEGKQQQGPLPWIWISRIIHRETIPTHQELAREAFEIIRAPDPQWFFYEYSQFGRILLGAGLFNGALAYFRYYLNNRPYSIEQEAPEHGLIRNLLEALGQFDSAIDLYTEIIDRYPEGPIARGERILLYSRTGQFEKADQELEVLAEVLPRNFPQFYQLYWRRELDAAKAYFGWLEKRKNLSSIYKFWGVLLMGEIDKGIDYVEEAIERGMPRPDVRLHLRRVLPQSIIREVEQHPRFQAMLAEFGWDDSWRDELVEMASNLTDVTGIHVQLDQAY